MKNAALFTFVIMLSGCAGMSGEQVADMMNAFSAGASQGANKRINCTSTPMPGSTWTTCS